MIRCCLYAAVIVALAATIDAKPAIYLHSVVNAATYAPPGLPGGSIAQGSLFTIFGAALGPSPASSQTAFPLATSFGGVSIQVTQGTVTVNALPIFVSPSQINAIMPSNAPLGWVSVSVTYNGKSNPAPVYLVHDSPGIFTFTGTGIGPATVQNAISGGNLVNNSNQVSAAPGQTEQMYLTGLGPISAADNVAPPAGNLATPVEVWVGGVPASVVYSGRSPCCSGLDQIDFVVPSNAPQGCWVPVNVRTSNSAVSNFTSMAIGTNGAPCSDSSNTLSAAVQSGGTLGNLSLFRMVVHEDVGVNAPVDVSNDFVTYSAFKPPAGPYAFLPFYSAPPPGSCTVYPGVGDFFQTGGVPQVTPQAIDGGTQLSLSGPGGQQSVTTSGSAAALGSYLPLYGFPNQLYLTPGAYTVTTNGGANVGAVKATVTAPAAPTWTNRDSITTVTRSQPLTLNWTGAVTDQPITIVAVGSDLPTNSSAVAFCVAPAGAAGFTLPPQVLAALPAARLNPLASKDVIYLYSVSASGLTASGLSAGAASGAFVLGKTVTFQ